MGLIQTTAPAVEPINLTEAKTHLRVDFDDDDALVSGLIIAAREIVEERTNRALITQSWKQGIDEFPDVIYTARSPLQVVSKLTYYDKSGTLQTLVENTDYFVDTLSAPGRISPVRCWPKSQKRPNAVQIEFTSGFGADEKSVPQTIKQAMLLLIGHLYENREAVVDKALVVLPMAVDYLLNPWRVWRYS